MIFSSIVFIFWFLPLIFTAYLLAGRRLRDLVLLAASLFFYAWGEKSYVLVLLGSIAVNYLFSIALRRASKPGEESGEGGRPDAVNRRLVAATGILFNVGLLACFKYGDFFLENMNLALGALGLPAVAFERGHAPIGISFFTFHCISYLVDIYRKEAEVPRDPLDFALYVSFFPKILAGPILKYRDAEKQLSGNELKVDRIVDGIRYFVIGLGKKVLIAGPIGAAADAVFSAPYEGLSPALAWFGIICYTLQIYFDFSGYTDMAIGLGKMFGFDLPQNFNYPYISQSIQEFWRRWHITLSQWFRDYLYIPLGGNRCSPARQYLNLLTVFLLCGLWHGANWTFVVWGLWHGLFLVLERTKFGEALKSSWRPLRHAYALLVTTVGWVFFRCDDMSHAFSYLSAMLGFSGAAIDPVAALHFNSEVAISLAVGAVLSVPVSRFTGRLAAASPRRPSGAGVDVAAVGLYGCYALFLGVVFLLSSMSLAGGTHNPFIYFQF